MAAKRPILVSGAAGKTGRAVLAALARRQAAARALARDSVQAAGLEAAGIEPVVGDLEDRQAVARAARGAGAIYHICPNVHPAEVAIGRGVIAAARATGVERFVLHSVLHPQVEAMPHHWAKLRVEERLLESGLDFTILQPAPYMQNVLAQWRSIRDHGVYRVPYDLSARVVMVDLEEVAEAAARVLTEPGHAGATYELCAPGLLDQHQIATVLGDALGRPVHAAVVPRAEWRERAAAAGLERARIETLLAMFRYYERFGMSGSPWVLERLLGRPPVRFADFARRPVDAG